VAITYTKGADAAAWVVNDIERAGGEAIAIQADATDADAVNAAVEKTVASFGRLDVLVNNAGTAIPKRFEETTLEEMDLVIDLNFRGPLIATQAALKHMNDGGRIIMVGSSVGDRMMTPGLVPYSATMGAVTSVFSGVIQRSGEPGHHGQQRATRSDRYGFKSRRGRMGGTPEGRHSAQSLRACGRGCRAGCVRG
jgi:3-oxoacyl-[acyl-carrier protein] reductase